MVERDVVVRRVRRQMRCMAPPAGVVALMVESGFAHEESFQNEIAEKVFRDPRVVQWPPSARYTRLLLRKYIDVLEEGRHAICDALVEYQMELLMAKAPNVEDGPQLCYRAWYIGAQDEPDEAQERADTITLRVAAGFHHTVGFATWESGCVLGEMFLTNAALIHGKRVLELGGGNAMSAVCAVRAQPARYVCTDYEEGVMANMRANLDLNGCESIETRALDMEELIGLKPRERNSTTAWLEPDQWDVIVGADIMYGPEMAELTTQSTSILLKQSPQAHVYLLGRNRNDETFAKLMAMMRAVEHFAVRNVTDELFPPERFRDTERKSVFILHVTSTAATVATTQ